MRIPGRRCSAVIVLAVLALSACDGGGDAPEPSTSPTSPTSPTVSSATVPALPTVSAATAGVPVAQIGDPLWSSSDKRVGLGRFRDATIVDGLVVLTGTRAVAAVTARTGRVLWSHRSRTSPALPGTATSYYSPYWISGKTTVSEPTGRIGRVALVGYSSLRDSEGYGLMALSVRTGEVVWKRRFAENRSQLPELRVVGASARHVLVSSVPTFASDARALMLDTATGKTMWQRTKAIAQSLSGDTAVLTDVTEARVETNPTRSGGPIIGVDARTARERWRVPGASADQVIQVGAPTDRTVIVGSEPSRLIDTSTGRTLWRSKGFSFCASDDHRLVVCASDEHLVSWSTADPVVRRSARTVEHLPRLVENGRVHLNGNSPPAVVDLSGSPLLPSLRMPVTAGGEGFVAIQGRGDEYQTDYEIVVRPVTPGR